MSRIQSWLRRPLERDRAVLKAIEDDSQSSPEIRARYSNTIQRWGAGAGALFIGGLVVNISMGEAIGLFLLPSGIALLGAAFSDRFLYLHRLARGEVQPGELSSARSDELGASTAAEIESR